MCAAAFAHLALHKTKNLTKKRWKKLFSAKTTAFAISILASEFICFFALHSRSVRAVYTLMYCNRSENLPNHSDYDNRDITP